MDGWLTNHSLSEQHISNDLLTLAGQRSRNSESPTRPVIKPKFVQELNNVVPARARERLVHASRAELDKSFEQMNGRM